MSDPTAPSTPPSSGDTNEQIDQALKNLTEGSEDPEKDRALADSIRAKSLEEARRKCDRPHVDEIQTWNPSYKAGNGPMN